MILTEQAKEYAKDKVIKALTTAIEQAYIDGYQAGYNDHAAGQPPAIKIDFDGIAYVDLGLPSGTKWASAFLKDEKGEDIRLPWIDAAKLSIPAIDQFEELEYYCRSRAEFGPNEEYLGTTYIGLNGNTLTLPGSGFEEDGEIRRKDVLTYWLKDCKDPNKTIRNCSFEREVISTYMEYKLKVLLVK